MYRLLVIRKKSKDYDTSYLNFKLTAKTPKQGKKSTRNNNYSMPFKVNDKGIRQRQ